jgi:CheY-like chemotaxis protein
MAESCNKRVLIVDNDEQEARTLGVMLEGAGYDSSMTWSGLEALERLQSGKYDIVLVSSYLPDLYVGDFFERLSHLPVKPCSIVMNEGRPPSATILEMKSMIGEVGEEGYQ